MTVEKEPGDEDIIVKIEKAKHYEVGDCVLYKYPGQGKEGFPRKPDKCEGWRHQKKDNKRSMGQYAIGFSLFMHPADLGTKVGLILLRRLGLG